MEAYFFTYGLKSVTAPQLLSYFQPFSLQKRIIRLYCSLKGLLLRLFKHGWLVRPLLIETAKANDLDPQTYINHILDHIATAGTLEKLEALLPWNVALS